MARMTLSPIMYEDYETPLLNYVLLHADNLELQCHQVRHIQACGSRIWALKSGRGLRKPSPHPPSRIYSDLGHYFCRAPNSLAERTIKNKNVGHIFRPRGAHLRPEGSKPGLSDLYYVRGRITGLRTQPSPGTFSCRRGPIPGLRESNASIERVYSKLNMAHYGSGMAISC